MPTSKAKAYRTQITLLVILGAAGLISVALLFISISGDLKQLRTAGTDNVQWTLSQAEVEFLEFEIQLDTATKAPEPDLAAVRSSFDIFYSRISTLSEASIYAPVREIEQFSNNLAALRSYLNF